MKVNWIAGIAAVVFAACSPFSKGQDLLPAEKAFKVDARRIANNLVEFEYTIAPGYILYKDRFAFEVADPTARVETVEMPNAQSKFDKVLGQNIDYYRDRVTVRVRVHPGNDRAGRLVAIAQGCATELGVCYPPVRKALDMDSAGNVESHMATAAQQSRRCGQGHVATTTDQRSKGSIAC